MVTILVGKENNSTNINIFTDADVGKNNCLVTFNYPDAGNLCPGEPKWANYVKGVIQYFEGRYLKQNLKLLFYYLNRHNVLF